MQAAAHSRRGGWHRASASEALPRRAGALAPQARVGKCSLWGSALAPQARVGKCSLWGNALAPQARSEAVGKCSEAVTRQRRQRGRCPERGVVGHELQVGRTQLVVEPKGARAFPHSPRPPRALGGSRPVAPLRSQPTSQPSPSSSARVGAARSADAARPVPDSPQGCRALLAILRADLPNKVIWRRADPAGRDLWKGQRARGQQATHSSRRGAHACSEVAAPCCPLKPLRRSTRRSTRAAARAARKSPRRSKFGHDGTADGRGSRAPR